MAVKGTYKVADIDSNVVVTSTVEISNLSLRRIGKGTYNAVHDCFTIKMSFVSTLTSSTSLFTSTVFPGRRFFTS